MQCKALISEGPKGGRRKGGRGRKLSHFSFCCAFRCCVVYSPCFPVWGEEKVMTIYDAGPLAAGPLCGLLMIPPLLSLLSFNEFLLNRALSREQVQKPTSMYIGMAALTEPTTLNISFYT